MNEIKRVLIVGSGIGGATAAYALRRVGVDVHCIDIKTETPMVGSGICMLHNAMRAMASLDLAQACLDSGYHFDAFRQFDSAGQLLRTNPAPPSCGIRRPELARILETAAEGAGAIFDRGLTVQSLVNRAEGVDVRFSDGREATYDLVVAADGVYSRLRQQLFGTDCSPRFAGQSVWRFNAPRPAEVDAFCLFRTASGRTVGAFPTSQESCYIFYLENSPEPLRVPEADAHLLIRERLSEFTAPAIRASLECVTQPRQVIFRPLDITLVPAPWHRERVVLLGDAAHAPTPHMTSGGGMAIEDAVVLADCIAATQSGQAALELYSNRRYERCKTICDASLQLCRNEQQDPLGNREKSAALLLSTYQFLGQPI
ncbi:FAD-dependent monooxygenase [Pseudomonas syringae]|nr:FAD-dependent monooxygenase [Pseudomonas syringae]MBD8792786.1 FAD-dependent monooxygenase [Pseudomonas syringae]MBD8803289.1 FAD-dependent monooxygenase [Pseudomonas syringae]MBD8811886.1 FAD-dependent monooxygenase [Pseudomonas syringae]